MPRLFTGLEIPAEVASTLAGFRGGLPGARWVDPENYHITLRFIGDIDHATARDIDALLHDMRRRPVSVTLDALASFGGGKPRAVFARAVPSTEMSDLQAAHERRVRQVGLPAETRKFTPHVSLARLRDASPLDVADYLAARGPFRSIRFTAERFVLFSSRNSVGGGPYIVEAAYPLG